MPEDSVLDRTKALVPYLREQAQAAEQARRLPDETFDALAEAGILKMCAPKKYGGEQLPFETQCDVLAEVGARVPVVVVGGDDPQRDGLVAGDVQRRSAGRSARGRRSADQRRGLADRHAHARRRRLHGSMAAGRSTPAVMDPGWAILGALLEGVPDTPDRCVRPNSSGSTTGTPAAWRRRAAALWSPRTSSFRLIAPRDDRHDGMASTPRTATTPETRTTACRWRRCWRSTPAARRSARRGVRWMRSWSDFPAARSPIRTTRPERGAGDPHQRRRGGVDHRFGRRPHAAGGAHPRSAGRRQRQLLRACERTRPRDLFTGLSRQAVDILFLASGASSIQQHVPIQRFQRDIQASRQPRHHARPDRQRDLRPSALRTRNRTR